MWNDAKLLNATANALFGVVALALLAAGLWWVIQRPMFMLQSIEVEGAANQGLRHVNAATIRGTALPRIKGNFFTVNLDAVRSAFEAVPWVRKASVRREWPDRLEVTLEEYMPLGTWGEEGRLLSVTGDVFTANLAEAEEDADLVEFAGPEGGEKEVVGMYGQLQGWFAPVNLAPEAVHLSARYAWDVRLNNGMTVELGREEDPAVMKERVARLVAAYPQLVARLKDKIESIDLRYPNGMALKADGLVLGTDKNNRKAS